MKKGPFPLGAFERLDESDDPVFYSEARKLVHIDEGAVEALRSFYSEVLPEAGKTLDLMSSWRSHLPGPFKGEAVGVGLNPEEMEDNPILSDFVVQDINRDPRTKFPPRSFDAAVMSVSVQYLTHPLDVFREVARLLKPESPFCVAFSDRCFWEKAVRMWRESDNESHIAIVKRYFELSEMFHPPKVVRRNTTPDRSVDPMFIVWALRGSTTPGEKR